MCKQNVIICYVGYEWRQQQQQQQHRQQRPEHSRAAVNGRVSAQHPSARTANIVNVQPADVVLLYVGTQEKHKQREPEGTHPNHTLTTVKSRRPTVPGSVVDAISGRTDALLLRSFKEYLN